MDFTEIETKLGLKFKNKELLRTAFTHRSYLNENPNYSNSSNERLEFLGDAVLQFLSSEYLYNKYEQYTEGYLTSFRASIVNTDSLAYEAARLNYGAYLLLSKGEESGGGRNRPYILANTFEAVLGALYLEADIDKCRKFLQKNLFYKIEEIVEKGDYRDKKSLFQELAQEKTGITPHYEVMNEWGPDHDKKFNVGVFLGNKKIAEGEGTSKQKAEINAAEKAIEVLSKLDS
jgi:ribonuclease III